MLGIFSSNIMIVASEDAEARRLHLRADIAYLHVDITSLKTYEVNYLNI
jgi:hypothetical protein